MSISSIVHEPCSGPTSLPPLRKVFPDFDQENLKRPTSSHGRGLALNPLTSPEMNKLGPTFARWHPYSPPRAHQPLHQQSYSSSAKPPQLSRTPSPILPRPVFSRSARSTPSPRSDSSAFSTPPMDCEADEERSEASSDGRPVVPRRHGGPARRAARPTYTEEEKHFVWYHRYDLALGWAEVNAAYGAQFPERPVQGLQCMAYRMIDDHRLPQMRRRSRAASPAQYGLRRTLPDVWYPWMRPRPSSAIR